MATVLERFMAKVDITDTCWLWRGSTRRTGISRGYGSFGIRLPDGRAQSVGAHRVAYELLVGPIPEGLTLDHLCRVRNCVNPAHLEPVTAEVNSSRQVSANKSKSHCPYGHPYEGENLKVRTENGHRACRECSKLRNREWRARRARIKAAVQCR